jgi:hypothetical protein
MIAENVAKVLHLSLSFSFNDAVAAGDKSAGTAARPGQTPFACPRPIDRRRLRRQLRAFAVLLGNRDTARKMTE